MTTTRTAYDASTPDRATFTSFTRNRVTFIPAPRLSQTESWTEKLQNASKLSLLRAKEVLDNNTGMLLVATSQAFFSLMNVFVKKLNSLDPPVPAFELILVRMGITWICCVSYMFITKIPHPFLGPPGVRLLLAFRGFVGFFGLFGVYYSLQYLSLSDATVLTFLAPMLTIFTGAMFLGEVMNWRQAFAGLCSFLGVILIARPASLFGRASQAISLADGTGQLVEELDTVVGTVTPSQRLGAVGIALLGVLGATGAYTTIRAIGRRAHPLHNLVSFSSQCVVVSVTAMIIMRVPVVFPMRWDWLVMLILIGIFGFIAQVLLTMGLQRENVGRGTMAVYVQIVFATAFERIFFHTAPSLLSIIGTLTIMSSALYVAITKEHTGAHKRASSLATSQEDISLEEGLLANQEEIEFQFEADDKVAELQDVAISASKLPDGNRDVDSSTVKPVAS